MIEVLSIEEEDLAHKLLYGEKRSKDHMRGWGSQEERKDMMAYIIVELGLRLKVVELGPSQSNCAQEN